MPWLLAVKGVAGGLVPGAGGRHRDRERPVRQHRPVGAPDRHLPDVACRRSRASTTAQWPGTGGTRAVLRGHRRRLPLVRQPEPDAAVTRSGTACPTRPSRSATCTSATLTAGGAATVTATVTNTGSRVRAPTSPSCTSPTRPPPASRRSSWKASSGSAWPPGHRRPSPSPSPSRTCSTGTASSNAWATSAGNYTVSVGDSSASLPLTGTLAVSVGPARRPGHPRQSRPAGQPGRQRRRHGHPQRDRRHQRPDADLLRHRPARRPVDLRRRHHLRHPHHRRNHHRDGHREGRQRRLRHPKLRVDRLSRHRQQRALPHWPDHRVRGPVPGRPLGQHCHLQPDPGLHLQRHRRPAVDGGVQRHPAGARPVPGRRWRRARPTAPSSTCTPATAPAPRYWVPQSNGELVNPNSGKCLDDTGYGGSGTQVQIWACADTSNQQWTLP